MLVRAGPPGRQGPRASYWVSLAAWLWGEVYGGGPGSGGGEDSFWLRQKRGGKTAHFQQVVCGSFLWQSLFWKIDDRN